MLPLLLLCLLPADPISAPTFRRDVAPLLKANCAVCHSEKNRTKPEVSGGVVLGDLPALLREKGGKLLKPGAPKDSLLLEALLRTDPDRRMPKDSDPLSKAEIDLVRRWIAEGAKEGESEAAAPAAGKTRSRRTLPLTLAAATPPPPPGALRPGLAGPLSVRLESPRLDPTTALAFSPEGKRLFVASFGRIAVWNLTEAKLERLLELPGHVHDLRFGPKGDVLAVAGGLPGEAGWVRLHDANTLELKRELTGLGDAVPGVAFHPRQPWLAAACLDKTIRLWNWETGQPLRDFIGHAEGVAAVAFSADGRHLFSAGKDRALRKFEVASGKSELTFSGHRDEALALAIAPDGTLLSGGADRGLCFWNPQTAERTRLQAACGPVFSLAAARSLAATAGPDGQLRLWNLPGGSLLRAIPAPGTQFAVALSADGARVAAGGADGLVRLWDARAGRPLATLFAADADRWLALTGEGYFACPEAHQPTVLQGAAKLTLEESAKLRKHGFVKQSLAGETPPPLVRPTPPKKSGKESP